MIRTPLRRAVLFTLLALAPAGRGDDWPQWLGPQRDGVWRETGILERFPPGGPKILWRTPIGSGYSGPAVVGNRVYVMDRVLPPGGVLPRNGFGQAGRATTSVERVVCLDAESGKIVWTDEYPCEYRIDYPAGPRCTPVVAGGRVYALGAMGDLRCLNADTGKPVWTRNLVKDYGASVQAWGFAAHPLLDGDRLISLVGGDGTVVVAFQKDTGKELWRSLSSAAVGYAPPVIYQVGNRRQLIVWHPERVSALAPETGKVLWEVETQRARSDLTVSMPRYDAGRLLVTAFYNGAMMLKLGQDRPTADVVWKSKTVSEQPDRTETLNSIMPTPVIEGDYIYGVCSYGQLRCLKANTGARVWMSMEATRAKKGGRMTPDTAQPDGRARDERWGNAFLVPHAGRYFLFNEKGDLIIAKLSPSGYQEIDRAPIIEPDNFMPGRAVVWSHPAFARRCAFVRNDREIACVSLAK